MITAEHESRRPADGTGFTDAVTYSFADPERGWYGLARLGLTADAGASALAVLFQDRQPVAVLAQGAIEVPAGAEWQHLRLDALSTRTERPLEQWHVTLDTPEHGFELTFTAISAPAQAGAAVAQTSGMAGYEQLCTVEGGVRTDGTTRAISGLGQRGHSWGAPDWSRLQLARSISAWLGPEAGGVTLTSVRGERAQTHADEAVWAALVHEGDPLEVAEPRVSTTYDAEGRQRRVGLELWVGEEDGYPFRAAGEIVCGSTLDLGQLRMDLAFIRWHAEGYEGVGRYDIVSRATP